MKTKEKSAHTSDQAADLLSEKAEQLKNAEQHLAKNCRGYILDNPVASLGIAVGIGFILSRLLSSR